MKNYISFGAYVHGFTGAEAWPLSENIRLQFWLGDGGKQGSIAIYIDEAAAEGLLAKLTSAIREREGK